MQHFINYIVMYGFCLGIVLFLITTIISIKDITKNKVNNIRVFLLPFIGVSSVFALTGISVIIRNIYQSVYNIRILILSSVSIIPLIILLIIYTLNYIDDKETEEI